MRPLFFALLLLFAGAAPANAAVTHEFADDTLTVTGDAADNTIVLTVNEGSIAVDGVRTGVPAGPDARIVVNALAGADTVDAGALAGGDYGVLNAIGGEDNDLLTGGDGSDVLIWNEGDDSDAMEGSGGNDGIQVNGSAAAETFSFGPDPGSLERVVLARTAPAPFTIEFEAERMEVKGSTGDDVISPDPASQIGIAGRTEPILRGEAGEDELSGGSGTDEIHGGEDADVLSGGRGFNVVFGDGAADRLEGGADEDFLFGGGGDDVVNGGDGEDFILWIDGDGDDTANGGAGLDLMDVEGGDAAEAFTYERNATEPGRFLFLGVDPVPFTIDFDAELLSIRGGAGNDFIFPSSLTGLETFMEGGLGNDEIVGGDGVDTIHGSAGTDEVFGGAGNDLLFGESDDDLIEGGDGEDFLRAGSGDDTVAWFDGDESDLVLGEAGFDRLRVVGSLAGSDQFELVAELGTTTLRRTNLTPFAIDLPSLPEPGNERSGGIEFVEIGGSGGNDTIDVSAGLGHLRVFASGGPGDDELRGAEEVDEFFGGQGNDTLVPGAGRDFADGQEGSDSLFTRDGAADVVRGGPDQDSAQTDALTLDAVSEVENLDAPPSPPTDGPPPPPPRDTVALLPRLGKAAVVKTGKRLVLKLPVSCPAGETGGCRSTLTVKSARGPRVTLGSKTVRLAAGGRATASIPVPRAAALARNGRLPVRIRIATADAAGNTATGTAAVTLRLPR